MLFGPIVRIGGGPLSLILNPFLEKTFGANREPGIHFTYGWQLKQEVAKGWWIGVEGFGRTPDFEGEGGAHEHRIGPVLTHEIEIGGKRTFTVEAGVQFGLNDTTPDTAAKVQLTLTYSGGIGVCQEVHRPSRRNLAGWRMHLARRMLRESNVGIAELAARVGYKSEAAFSRAFGAPLVYRRRLGGMRRRGPALRSDVSNPREIQIGGNRTFDSERYDYRTAAKLQVALGHWGQPTEVTAAIGGSQCCRGGEE